MKKKIENEYTHNSGGYGYGKFWVAKLEGLDPKFSFKRNFLNRYEDRDHSSRLTYWSWEVYIKEDGIYEIYEENNFKSYRKFIEIKNGKIKEIDREKLFKIFKE